MALEALFTGQTLGGASILLTDEAATRARIEAEFATLQDCSPDDTVVIGLLGYGSETHELVTHDTQVHDLGCTAIHLDQVQQWFARIPARRVVLFLDCCFLRKVLARKSCRLMLSRATCRRSKHVLISSLARGG